jgi:hypothetical protein
MNGIEIARRYYLDEVAPGLAGTRHAAALLGSGSEVLGFDDEVSTDHDFGPRVQIFQGGRETVGGFFAERLGFDPGAGVTTADWLLTPTPILAGLTRGAVFHDPDGELARYRAALAWYPDDVWRYALAAAWLRVGQEEPWVARTGSTGDDLGSRILAARLTRELARIAFLVSRCWAPYGKWFGRAFTELDLARGAGAAAALSATGWPDREAALVAFAGRLAVATNELGLCEPQDPAPRPFFTREIRVIDGGRFARALCARITDPVLRGILERVGDNQGTPCLPGTIDQAVDSTDILTRPARFRSAAALLGLGPQPG